MSLAALDEAIKAAGVPIYGVARLNNGTVRIDFRPEATDQQRLDAQAIADGWDWTPLTPVQLLRREAAKLLASDRREDAAMMRAVVLSINERENAMSERINLLADKLNAVLTAIDNGANLAGVKTNIAAIADAPNNMPTYTPQQVRTGITGKIEDGSADN